MKILRVFCSVAGIVFGVYKRAMALGGILKTLLWAGIILPGALDAAELAPDSSAQIPLAVESMVYDPVSQRIYASSTNGIAVINPLLAEVETNLNFGAVGQLALTDDGQFLYFATSNNTAVAQLNLATKNLERVFWITDFLPGIPGVPLSESEAISEIKAVPGWPDSLVVASSKSYFGSGNIRVFVNGEPRSTVLNIMRGYLGAPSFSNLQFQQDGVLFSLSGKLRKFKVDENGIVETGFEYSGDNSLSDGPFKTANNLIFTPSGEVFETFTGSLIDKIALSPIGVWQPQAVLPDPESGLLFLGPMFGHMHIEAYDLKTLGFVGEFEFAAPLLDSDSLLRWGADGFAYFVQGGPIVILRSSILPAAPSADLAVGQTVTSESITNGDAFTYTLSITNLGPNDAYNVIISDLFPAGATLVNIDPELPAISSQACINCASQPRKSYVIGTLTNGEVIRLTLSFQSGMAGNLVNTVSVTSKAIDPDRSNNVSSESISVLLRGDPECIEALNLDIQAMVYDPAGQKIYAVILNREKHLVEIASINPVTGQIASKKTFDDGLPTKLAVSADGKYLYAAFSKQAAVERFLLPSLISDQRFIVQPDSLTGKFAITALQVMADNSEVVAVGVTAVYDDSFLHLDPPPASIVLYTNGVKSPNEVSNARDFVVSTSSNLFVWASSWWGQSELRRYQYGETGFYLVETVQRDFWDRFSNNGKKIDWADGRIFFSTGSVMNETLNIGMIDTWADLAPDNALQRVFCLVHEPNEIYYPWWNFLPRALAAFDTRNLSFLGIISLSNVNYSVTSLMRCGTDRIALNTSEKQIHICRTSLASDADHDGIPDSWQIQQFGTFSSPNARASADPDGDHYTNFQEYIAGTNPNDAQSLMRANLPHFDKDSQKIGFETVSDKNYTLEVSEDLQTWRAVGQCVGNGGEMQLEAANDDASSRFYRLKVSP